MPKTKEQIAAYNKEYFARPEVKERAKIRNQKYRARRAAYKKSDAGKAAELRYRQTNENAIKYQHEYRLKKLYGITENEYQELYRLQAGACKICSVMVNNRLHIDHDHETGKVRGLLCGSCNRGIGMFKDNATLLRKAANYIDAV